MELMEPVKAFEALAHDTRLAVFRLLIPAGRDGLSAGVVGKRLALAPNSLSFHLARLANAGLIRRRRQGRHLYYRVDYARLADLVGFLTDECCAAAPDGCLSNGPATAPAHGPGNRRTTATPPERR